MVQERMQSSTRQQFSSWCNDGSVDLCREMLQGSCKYAQADLPQHAQATMDVDQEPCCVLPCQAADRLHLPCWSWFLQALAYLATGNEQYARNAVDIADAWATTNKVFGVVWENGPLEAGWFVASVVKGLELLKYTWPGYSTYKVGASAHCEPHVPAMVELLSTVQPQLAWRHAARWRQPTCYHNVLNRCSGSLVSSCLAGCLTKPSVPASLPCTCNCVFQPDMEANFNSWVDKLVLPSWFRYLTYARKETNQFGNWHRQVLKDVAYTSALP